MKNFIPLVMMLLFSINLFAQDTIVVSDETLSTAERVIDKYSGKAYDAVKELASALKVPAEHVYTVLVKQAVVEAILYLIIFILAIIGLIISFKLTLKAINLDAKRSDTAIPYTILGVIIAITSILLLIGGLFNIDTIVGGFVNPEYYAIKEIIDTFN